MSNKVVRIFLDSDLRCQHRGLILKAAKKKVRVEALKPGEHVLFVNAARNKVKMFSPNGVLSYLKLDRGVLDVRAIAQIPQSFGKDITLGYKSGLKKVFEKKGVSNGAKRKTKTTVTPGLLRKKVSSNKVRRSSASA